MNLEVSNEAAKWYKNEVDLEPISPNCMVYSNLPSELFCRCIYWKGRGYCNKRGLLFILMTMIPGLCGK